MSVFASNINHRSYYAQISALCFVLGLLLAAAAFATNRISQTGGPERIGFFTPQPASKRSLAADYQGEIKKLNKRNQELEQAATKGSAMSQTLLSELKEMRQAAGLTDVVGPGIEVMLEDSKKRQDVLSMRPPEDFLIHDFELANVVNELRQCGAEAIAINGQRVTAQTAIRCTGPTIEVNSNPMTPPFSIQAIGSPETLYTGLNMRGGVLERMKTTDPNMARVTRRQKLRLPAFSGVTHARYSKSLNNAGPAGSAGGTDR